MYYIITNDGDYRGPFFSRGVAEALMNATYNEDEIVEREIEVIDDEEMD